MGGLTYPLRALITLSALINHVLFTSASIQLDLGSTQSIKSVSRQLADSTMSYYIGNQTGQTPGLLPAAGSFQWWIGGALFGQMIEYWYYTGDPTYNNVVLQAMMFQTGDANNYEPVNQTRTEGNDDQAFWAFAAMSAAEFDFPNPPPDKPQWLALAQAVFNRQASRWDETNCGGGLRWQFNPFNAGYDSKNTISNGAFFQLAARLARYTKNETYADWANKTYDWMAFQSPLIDKDFSVYDGIGFDPASKKCPTSLGRIEWTYNIGTMLAGSAYMYNHTQNDVWKQRIDGYLKHLQVVFFPKERGGGNIMVEYACEPLGTCNSDQRSFKAYLARWLAVTVQLAPYTTGTIMPWLQGSAAAAAQVCDGTGKDIKCGRQWWIGKNDGTTDVGNQMTAMSVVQSNLIVRVDAPKDTQTGSSQGNAAAGNAIPNAPSLPDVAIRPISTADIAGAWLLTALVIGVMSAGAFFMVWEKDDLMKPSVHPTVPFTGQWPR